MTRLLPSSPSSCSSLVAVAACSLVFSLVLLVSTEQNAALGLVQCFYRSLKVGGDKSPREDQG